MRSRLFRTLLCAAVGAGTMFIGPTPADASYDDSFNKCTTTTSCAGRVRFVDHGEGKPGGGSNDDYIVCEDNDSFYMAGCWLWHNGAFQSGVESTSDTDIVWEPYKYWNVKPGDLVEIKVCVRRTYGASWDDCAVAVHRSYDG